MSVVWEQRSIHALDGEASELVAVLAPLPDDCINVSITHSVGKVSRISLSFSQAEEFGRLLINMARQAQPEFK
jgi:hypothetical protein